MRYRLSLPLWFPPARPLQSSTMGGGSAGLLRYCWYSWSCDVNLWANSSSYFCRFSLVSAILEAVKIGILKFRIVLKYTYIVVACCVTG